MSFRDFHEQVTQCYPTGTSVLSEECLRLQFWSKTPKAKVSIHYTGRLYVHFMVQKQQFQKCHENEHYVAAIFRYMHEYTFLHFA